MAKTSFNKNENAKYSLKGSCLWGILIFFLLIVIDLVTKMVAEVYFTSEGAKQRIDIIPGWIALTFAQNRGISYGLGSDAKEWVKIAVIAGTFVMMLLLAVLYFKLDKRRSFMRLALVFVVAGGVGNLIDRLLFQVWLENGGGVRDMVALDFGPLLYQWFGWEINWLNFGVCNCADFFIVGGAIALIVCFLFFDTDSFYPVGKYKQLALEADAREKEKQAAKTVAKSVAETEQTAEQTAEQTQETQEERE